MRNDIAGFFLLLSICILLIGCKSEYQRYVDRELAKGMISDSLIFGLHMGQTQKDFFSKCWQLNSDSIISQGSGNRMARYIEPATTDTSLIGRKQMDFYGIFDQDKVMRGMDMIYHYVAWAPWNTQLYADSLALELKDIYWRNYGGNEFIDIDLSEVEYKAYVKIDGNREILIFPRNDKEVIVRIEDLNFKYKL